jgi:tetratricopeptide (TPR) repeat protein
MNAVSAIDDRTAAAIRRAIGEASVGRLASACEIGQRALDEGGQPVALNAMLGMLRCRSGEFELALVHLRPAYTARPGDVSIASNLLMALVESGRTEEAFALASPELANADRSLTIARYRGYVAQLLGQSGAASEAYEAVVAAAPNDWQSWNNLGNARLLLGDFEGAVEAFRRSLDLHANSVVNWLNFARALVKCGQFDEAEEQLRKAADRFPADAEPLKDLHELMRRRGGVDAALHDVLERALERAPRDKDLLLAVSPHRVLAEQFDAAERACRAVLDADPHDLDAWLDLAYYYEHTDPERLSGLLAEIEHARVPSPVPDVVRAFVHRRNKQQSEGLAALKPVPPDFRPWMVEDLRGQFLDKLGETDAAFAAFTRMNEAAAAEPPELLAHAAHYRSAIRARLDSTTGDWLATWKAGLVPPERPSPAFLVGFPRSGTTLLDTMLMGHPDVAVMEEKPVLDGVSRSLGGFEAIPDLDEQGIREARDRYFEGAARAGADSARSVLVDKNPLHLMQVPLIHRLFPDARFILALRHPADVVLSCYFTNFRPTPQLANFLRLETAAEFYDLAFETWERALELMPIDVHAIVYEQLVEDPEAQLRALAEYLGLNWRDELLDHTATAASRGLIATASYAQVTEPVYRKSVGRWQAYRAHLEPIFPMLRPWAEKFGYSI